MKFVLYNINSSGINSMSNCLKLTNMKKRIAFLMCILALFSSCSKDRDPKFGSVSKVEKRILTPEEAILKEKLALTAEVVRDVLIKTPEAVKEVSDFINLKMYKDDFVYFRDLFNPEENPRIKGLNISQTLFEKTFDDILARKSNSKIDFDLKEFLVANLITLYCPYPVSDYPDIDEVPSCTSDPIDNEEENIGYEILPDGSYNEVNVDEDYTWNHPVLIVAPDDSDDISTPPVTTATDKIHQLRVGYVKSTLQYDGLFWEVLNLNFVSWEEL